MPFSWTGMPNEESSYHAINHSDHSDRFHSLIIFSNSEFDFSVDSGTLTMNN